MCELAHNWKQWHLFIVHFPIVALMAAPFLIIAALAASTAKKRLYLQSALILMMFGTATSYIAAATGQLAVRVIGSAPAVNHVLTEHRYFGETTVELFSLLTLVFATLLVALKLTSGKLDAWVGSALLSAFLIFYATGAVSLINTAVEGGHLARVLSVHRPTPFSLPVNTPRERNTVSWQSRVRQKR